MAQNKKLLSFLKSPVCGFGIANITLPSPIVINMPTRASLAVTKGLLFLWLAHLNNKNNVFKPERSSLLGDNRLQIALFTFEETSN